MQRDTWVLREPRVDLWVLLGVVVVDDDVQLAAGVGVGDLLQEVAELGLALPFVARVGDLAGRNLESGQQGGGAVALVVVGRLLGGAGRLGKIGAVRSKAWIWIWDF